MSQHTLATLSAILVLVALIAYAVFGGADFGGGIWDLAARGPTRERQRAAIAQGMGPVWESNNVWLIFVLVVTWTAFPIVFAGVSTALFIPISLALVGIVLRGASFSFRSNYGMQIGTGQRWGYVFSIASTITPFLLGTIAGALASGGIRISGPPLQVDANIWTTWTTPFALACGAFAVGLCSVLSATYLTVDAHNANDHLMAATFRQHAMVAGAVTALLGALAAVLAISGAPTLWRGLIGMALPFSLGAVVLGLATAAALLRDAYRVAQILVAAETTCVFIAWGVGQWPYLIVPDVTVDSAASPASVLGPTLIVALLGLVIVIPSLWFLFYVFKRGSAPGRPAGGARATAASFALSLPQADVLGEPTIRTQASSVHLRPTSEGAHAIEAAFVFLAAVAVSVAVTGLGSLLAGANNRAGQGIASIRKRSRRTAHSA